MGNKGNGFADVEFGLFEDGIVFDHLSGKTHYFYREENRIEKAKDLLRDSAGNDRVSFGKPRSNVSQEDFCERVEEAKNYIGSGDVFQVVLSKRYKIPFKGSLLQFYRALRRINPSPYMYYLKFGDRKSSGPARKCWLGRSDVARRAFPSLERGHSPGTLLETKHLQPNCFRTRRNEQNM